jgi:predicted transcriptional regulator
MGTARRDRWDIIYDVLVVARSDVKRTKLMQKANMSYSQLSDVFKIVGTKVLRSYQNEEGSTFYKTTPDGEKFIAYMDELRDLLPIELKRNLNY